MFRRLASQLLNGKGSKPNPASGSRDFLRQVIEGDEPSTVVVQAQSEPTELENGNSGFHRTSLVRVDDGRLVFHLEWCVDDPPTSNSVIAELVEYSAEIDNLTLIGIAEWSMDCCGITNKKVVNQVLQNADAMSMQFLELCQANLRDCN